MPALLKTQCPQCRLVVKADGGLVGKRVRCPGCKHVFELASVQSASKSDLLEGAPTAKETVEGSAHGTLPGIAVDVVAKSREQARFSGKLGRFDLEELLGQGAYGRVYRAYDPQLDREVALKVPMFDPDDKHKIQRFSAEAKAAARLRHPNIVPTYESGQFGGQYYIAAQFVSGQTLAQRLAQGRPDFRQVADWVGQLADALAHAHRQGIVHRDIKPENIMLDEHEKPLIMDFGLAKRMNEDAAITTDGSILGTPAYMPPEQARGDVEKIGPHSDQYSLGAVLYELLTGKRPFDGPPHSVIAQVLSTEPRPPRSIRREIPSDLAALCQVAMSKESADRYPTCSDFAADLARWLGGYETQARPLGQIERGLRWCRRNTLVAGMLASILILLAFGLATASTLYWTVAMHKQQTIAGEKTNPDSSITPLSPNTPIATDVPSAAKTMADVDDPPTTTKVEFKPLDLTNLKPHIDDNFQDPRTSAFGRLADMGYGALFHEGGLYVGLMSPRPGVTHRHSFVDAAPCVSADFACQATGRVRADNDEGWSVYLHTERRDRFVSIRVNNNREIEISDAPRDPNYKITKGPFPNSAIRPVNEFNTLLVLLRDGQTLEVSANGQPVTAPLQFDPPLGPVVPALAFWQRDGNDQATIRAEFSRFTIWLNPK